MKEKTGTLIGIVSNLLEVEVNVAVMQNEICFVDAMGVKLMGEVIKIDDEIAYVQLFENPAGLKIGMKVHFTSAMHEVLLGPGLLGKKLDGLQNDLDKMNGIFLRAGDYNSALDNDALWHFEPEVVVGDMVKAGDWVGRVQEYSVVHQILVPFAAKGNWKIKKIVAEGDYTIDDVIAVAENNTGDKLLLKLCFRWPARIPVKAYHHMHRPYKMLETGIRVFDSLAPMLEGGTGFIPGPFGCGKTVLQHLLSKYANVDVVVIAACGERANEVVELFTEFPELDDPRTGRKLIERTVIVANTSNMPVAAREASVYTAMSMCEYYRSMGLRVLLLADSTSRWAQALREMSNRMEELPGPDAFPVDLPAIIANYYARAGIVSLNNGKQGSVTFIGTVSPAGGNLKEPVTESTKKAARCFYALSQKRADGKRYPAVDPLESYSKYLEYAEFLKYAQKNISENWVGNILWGHNLLQKGKDAADQISILGDDGVPLDYHITFWKAELFDFVILQQDAFDENDCFSSLKRQDYMLGLVVRLLQCEIDFSSYEDIALFFKRALNMLKQMNYSRFESNEFKEFQLEAESLFHGEEIVLK